jgi:hypothetical protein
MSDPRQREFAGADDFNLVGETVQDWTAPPPADETTLDLPLE